MREPALGDLLTALRARPWAVPISVAVCVLVAVVILHMITPQVTARMVVAPTARDHAVGRGLPVMTDKEQNFGPRAVTEGYRDETLSDFARFLQVLTAPETATLLLADKKLDLAATLFPDEWDAQTKSWHPPQNVAGRVRHVLRWLVGMGGWHPPDAERVAAVLKRRLIINRIGTSPMREIAWRDTDRGAALAVLSALHAAADAHVRDRARDRTAAEIGYLRAALNRVTIEAHRQVLIQLLAAQEQTQMMIVVDLPFAADTIEAPRAPQTPDWPNVPLVLVLAVCAGVMIGLLRVYAGLFQTLAKRF